MATTLAIRPFSSPVPGQTPDVIAVNSRGNDNILAAKINALLSATATPATTGAMTVTMSAGVVAITPTGACTFNAVGGIAGQRCVFAITTSGASSYTLTWGTNFRTTSTLATGSTTARLFTVEFICIDGTSWAEVARTTAMA